MHIKQKISQTVDGRFALVSSDVLYDVGMMPDDDICSAVNELFGETFLGDAMRGLVFQSSMDRHDVDVSVRCVFSQYTTIRLKQVSQGDSKVKTFSSDFDAANPCLVLVIFLEIGTASHISYRQYIICLELFDRLLVRLDTSV